MNRYWVSFAKGKFLGVVLTEARNQSHAIHRINRLGLNPGGQAMVCYFSPPGQNSVQDAEWDRYEKDMLISEDELRAGGCRKVSEIDGGLERARTDPRVEFVCDDCNETDCQCN